MRIGLVALHTSPAATPGQGDAGGLNVVVSQAAQALANRGHDVTLVTRANNSVSAGSHAFGEEPSHPKGRLQLVAIEAGGAELQKLELVGVLGECAREIEKLGPFDVLHSHYWLSGVATAEVANTLGTPHVTTLHTVGAQKNVHLSPGDTPEPAVRIDGERTLTRLAPVVASSHSELQGIVDGYGPPPHGARVVTPGVDTELFHPRDKPNNRYRVTVLGRVQPLKGQDLAIRAIRALAQFDPELAARVELVIAGEPTPGAEAYAAELRELASQVTHVKVTFVPALSREEAADLLGTSHLVLIPSHSETFGLVALEAAAAGTPTVVSHTTGLTEAVHDGVSGVHVRSRDADEWARVIHNLLTDDEHRQRHATSARAHALTHSWGRHAADLEALYEQLIAESRKP